MTRFEEVPDLRVVAVADLLLHEDTDPDRVARLMQRVEGDGLLKNPPIVAPLESGDRFVVLDGANRTSALARLGVRDAVVQVVDYSQVQLDTWNHLVAGIHEQTLFERLQQVPGIRMRTVDLETARRLWQERAVLAYIVCRNGEVHVIESGGSLEENARLLKQMSDAYRGVGTIYRVQTDETQAMLPFYEDVAATIIYPPFQPAEIIELAKNSVKLPTGITRHIIPYRALRINIPLDFLKENRSLAEKNAWLREWMRRKLQNKEVRYYQEPTVLFDE